MMCVLSLSMQVDWGVFVLPERRNLRNGQPSFLTQDTKMNSGPHGLSVEGKDVCYLGGMCQFDRNR